MEDVARPAASKGKERGPVRSRRLMSEPFPSGLTLPVVKSNTRKGRKDFDPTRSGNPLLDTCAHNRVKMVADDFSLGEFTHSGDEVYDQSRLDPQLVACLQSVRDLVGKPVLVGSGYRSYWRNLAVYKKMRQRPTASTPPAAPPTSRSKG